MYKHLSSSPGYRKRPYRKVSRGSNTTLNTERPLNSSWTLKVGYAYSEAGVPLPDDEGLSTPTCLRSPRFLLSGGCLTPENAPLLLGQVKFIIS